MTKLYRYEIEYSGDGQETSVELREYEVIRETEQTYFIQKTKYPVLDNKLKRVLKIRDYGNGCEESGINNRFAYLSKKDAMMNFKIRTEKRVSWYRYWSNECKKALEIVDRRNKQ